MVAGRSAASTAVGRKTPIVSLLREFELFEALEVLPSSRTHIQSILIAVIDGTTLQCTKQYVKKLSIDQVRVEVTGDVLVILFRTKYEV